jgi:hypothetical protein
MDQTNQELVALRLLRDRLRTFLEKAKKDGIEITIFNALLRECDRYSELPIPGRDWVSPCNRMTAQYSEVEQEGITQIAWIVSLDGKYLGMYDNVPLELLTK